MNPCYKRTKNIKSIGGLMGIGPLQVVHVRLLCFAQLLLLALGLLLLNVSVGAFGTILVAKEPL